MRALEDWVEVDEGRDMSCPMGGSGEGARSSSEVLTEIGGRLRNMVSGVALGEASRG